MVTACNDVAQNEEEGTKIAKVFNIYLTDEQLLRDLPDELTGEDSINFRTQYIDNWIKEQVLVQTAENELPETKKDVDYQLMKYRNSLLIYEYEKQYIKERLDTNVSIDEIQKFYEENQDEFLLRDFIVKTVYVKYTNNTPDIEKVAKWYKYQLPNDEMNLKQHIDNFAVNFHYDTTNWMYFNDVLKDIPLQDFNKSSFIKNEKEVTFEEGGFVYFLNILDYKLKDELSPIEFEKDRIKSILLNMRTNEIRKVLNSQVYEDALKTKQIIIY